MKPSVAARLASLFALILLSFGAFAACPVGKQGGGTWCEKGWEWKCEKCGSEYCPIMTGRKCFRDDAGLPPMKLGRLLDETADLSLAVLRQRQFADTRSASPR
jgi:hypothetical protein